MCVRHGTLTTADDLLTQKLSWPLDGQKIQQQVECLLTVQQTHLYQVLYYYCLIINYSCSLGFHCIFEFTRIVFWSSANLLRSGTYGAKETKEDNIHTDESIGGSAE